MPAILLTGPAGRIEARHDPAATAKAPVVVVLHGHPRMGGELRAPAPHAIHHAFVGRGFHALRFNFRGVGRSEGKFTNGAGELEDANAALDWMQLEHPDAAACWIAGHGFGAHVAMHLLMRRPEIGRFVAVAPLTEMDFSFLAPCPSPGLVAAGAVDKIAPPAKVEELAQTLHNPPHSPVAFAAVPKAGHLFADEAAQALRATLENYVDEAAAEAEAAP